ncbi:MAG: glycosyltransferase [Acidobacteriia bacterium]|nr:glycosyltransferase [Terriglobia bacterium]
MHLLHLNYWYDAELDSPEALLARYRILTGWSEAIQAAGVRVTVLQRFREETRLERNGVMYHFRRDSYPPELRKWQVPTQLHRHASELCSQTLAAGESAIVHFNGLLFPLQLRALRKMLPAACPIVVQEHADQLWPAWRQPVLRWGLKAADAFCFSAGQSAEPWLDRGLIPDPRLVHQILVASTPFRRQDRAAACAQTGLRGEPVVVWVGRLTENKDPITVLTGFEMVLKQVPTARLYMVYGSEELLPQVRAKIESSPTLNKAVTLLGSFAYADLEAVYNSADYFVLGSHREGASGALVEALACGVVPVVTDIPSSRRLTDGGKIGGHWPPGAVTAPSLQSLQPLAARRRDAQWLPWSVDTRFFDAPVERPPGPPWHLLRVTSLNPVKDQATLLRALRFVVDRGQGAHLDIVGEDALNGSIERLAAEPRRRGARDSTASSRRRRLRLSTAAPIITSSPRCTRARELRFWKPPPSASPRSERLSACSRNSRPRRRSLCRWAMPKRLRRAFFPCCRTPSAGSGWNTPPSPSCAATTPTEQRRNSRKSTLGWPEAEALRRMRRRSDCCISGRLAIMAC